MVRYGYNAADLIGTDVHSDLALLIADVVAIMPTGKIQIVAEKQLSKFSLL